MLLPKIKDRFLSGDFVLHCSLITLEQCGTEVEPKIYAGSGSIALNPRKGFTGSFVSPVPLDTFRQLMDDQQLVSGEIIPDSYFYRLQAISLDGTAWGNPKVAIGLEFDATGTLVTFEPDFLSTLRPITEASQTVANFVFLETLPFPLTHGTNTIEKGLDGEQSRWKRDQGEARTARMHLKYREWKEKTTHSQVTAIFFDTAPLGFEHRLLEAIRFSTAVPASWVMLEYVQDGLVHFELSPYRPALNHLVDEPLQARENALDFFRLFDSYYVHSSENAKGEEFSQLSVAIGALFNLKGLAIGEISLVIGVTIEALLKEGFSELEEIDPEIIVEVEVVEDVINSLTTIREKSRGRMKGSMSGIKSIRARDKLEKLQKLGLVNQMELQHWKKLRNTSAHGSLRIDPQKWQQHLQRIFAVTTLAYKLTFLRIGYFGPYTDYGSPGWPTAWFPTKDDAQKLSRVTEELAQLPVADVKGKLYAWKAVETALRNTFPEGDVGALRASASLVLLAAMRKVGTLRLAELGSGN